MLILLLLTICICLLGLVFYYAKRADRPFEQPLVEAVQAASLSQERKLVLRIEVAKIEAARMPWFERSLSSIGVVVFLSTLAVAAVQAWQADGARRDAEVVRIEQRRLTAEAVTQKQLLEIGAEQLLENYDRNLKLRDAERTLLRQTVQYRLEKRDRTPADTRFLFRAYTILNEWDEAAALLVGNSGPAANEFNSQDVVTAAYRLYIIGEPEAAIQAVSTLDLERPDVSERAKMDAWALRWAVQTDQHDAIAGEVVKLLKVDLGVAKNSLTDRALKLRSSAAGYRRSEAARRIGNAKR